MMGDGFKLMVLGMGSVFVFLTLMVFLMELMSKLLAPFAGALVKAAPAKPAARAASQDDAVIAAAAAAAVDAFRRK